MLPLLWLLLTVPTLAQSWDPFPPLGPNQHLAVSRNLQSMGWTELQSCLRSFDSAVGARYHAAVVEISAANGSDSPEFSNAVPYVDALYQAWRKARRLDPETHVLIALSLKNRGVAIHPGTRWVDLGFATGTIKNTIDQSRFPTLARSGELEQAVCELAKAVDARLAAFQQAVDARRAGIKAELTDLQQQSDAVAKRLSEDPELGGPRVEKGRQALEQIDLGLADARRALDRGRLGETNTLLPRLSTELESLTTNLDAAEELRRLLPGLEEEITRRQEGLEQETGSERSIFDPAREAIASCSAQVTELAQRLEAGEQVEAAIARACLAEIDREIERGRATHDLLYVKLPRLLAAAAAILLVVLLVFLRRRRNRARQRMREELDRWQTSLNHAADRLLEIETRYPLYFVAEPWRWEGESLELDRTCAEAVNRLYLFYSTAFELSDKAKRMAVIAEGSWLRHRPYDEVWHLLRQSPVHFETGEAEERRRIFLPLRQEYHGTSMTLLEDLDRAYAEARNLLEEVTRIDERHRQLAAEVREGIDRTRAEIERRAALELPTDHLHPALDPLQSERQRIEEEHQRDPIRAIAAYELLAEALQELHDRAASGNRAVERLRGPVPEQGRHLRQEVGRLRALGFELEEPGFEPDVELDTTVRRANQIVDLVAAGDESTATRRLEQLTAQLDDLAQNLGKIEKARDGVPADLDALADRVRSLERRIPRARADLEALRAEHVVTSFEAESDNLDELEKALVDVGGLRRGAGEDHRAEHYLAALVKLEEAWRLTDLGSALLDEIDHAKERLDALRDLAERGLVRCREARAQLPAELERRGLGSDLRRRFETWSRGVDDLVERSSITPLDWARVVHEATTAEDRLASLRDESERCIADYNRCRSSLEVSRQQLGSLRHQVEAEERDRPYVGRAVEEAEKLLRAFEAELERDEASGSEALLRLREVETALHQARQSWTSEMELVVQAEQQIDAARRRLPLFGYAAGSSAIEEAESLAARRDWEAALRQAQHAYRLIEVELERRAEEARRQAEEARRRAAAAASAAAAAASRSRSSSFSSSSSRSSSSGSSWSSSSGGSSFSRSSSGGSSW